MRRNHARQPETPESERRQIVVEMGQGWTRQFLKLEKDMAAERVPMSLKAGDVVFWHSLLAHGGSPRINPALSRKSAVFHFVGRNTKLYTFDQFMLYDRHQLLEQVAQPMNLLNYQGKLDYMHYGHFVTYTPDEIIHKCERDNAPDSNAIAAASLPDDATIDAPLLVGRQYGILKSTSAAFKRKFSFFGRKNN